MRPTASLNRAAGAALLCVALGVATLTGWAGGPDELSEEAAALQADGRWEEAAEAWQLVLEEEPDNGTAWFNLGYSLHAAGRLDEAIRAHKRAAEFDDLRGIALYNLGCAYALTGRSDKALKALAASLEAGFDVRRHAGNDSDLESLRDDPRFRELLTGEPREKEKEKKKETEKGSTSSIYEEAAALHEEGRWEEAAEAWMQVVHEDPDNATAWFNLGYSLHAAGRLEQAVKAHRKASEFDDYHGIALYNLGCALALMDRPDDAFEALEASQDAGFGVRRHAEHDSDLDSLRRDPRFNEMIAREPAGWKGKVQQLLTSLQQTLKQKAPEIKQALAGIAQQAKQLVAHWKQRFGGDHQQAAQADEGETAAGALADHGDQTPPSIDRARRLQQSGMWREAAAMYAAVTDEQPDNAEAWFGMAYCLHMDGDYDKAIKAHKKAATFDRIRGISLYNLACAYALTGHTDQAFEALEDARAAGFDIAEHIMNDSDLKSLRDDPRFHELATRLKVEL